VLRLVFDTAALLFQTGSYADRPLTANKVDFFEPMKIKWYYGYTNAPDCLSAGTSTNQVYVTLRVPTNAVALYHTVARQRRSLGNSPTGL